MSNTSATGGYLFPLPPPAPAPIEGQSFNRFLNEVVVGISGLPGSFVRPRWQPEPANVPNLNEDWLSFGIQSKRADTYAVELHDGSGDGSDEIQRHETVEVLLSFYGPNADANLEIFREGLQVAQNREVFQLNAMGQTETGDAITIPALVKERWYYRVDMTWIFRRQIRRIYPVLNLLSFDGTLNADGSIEIIDGISVVSA